MGSNSWLDGLKVKTIFLPTQAASDTDIFNKVQKSLQNETRLIVTTGFLASAQNGVELAKLAGIEPPIVLKSLKAQSVIIKEQTVEMDLPLDMETNLSVSDAEIMLEALVDGVKIPYLTRNKGNNIFVLNSHTFSQADFDAVGEVLLCPKPLGMLQLPDEWANVIRDVFNAPLNLRMEAPVKVSLQILGNGDIVLHNYNDDKIDARLKQVKSQYVDVITKKEIPIENGAALLNMPGRSRVWLKQQHDK